MRKKAYRITDSVQVPGRIEIVNDDMSFNWAQPTSPSRVEIGCYVI